MKKYFQKLYNETGTKPFTFLNCFLIIFLPIVFAILAGVSGTNESKILILAIVGFVLGLVGNTLIQFRRFSDVKKALWLTVLNLLASIHFFCKLILFPVIGFFINMSGAMTSMQAGNYNQATSETNHAMKAEGLKLSAFNWFKYDGTKFQDIEGEDTPIVYENSNAYDATLGRSYTDREDANARSMGYTDAQDAVSSGVRVEDLNK